MAARALADVGERSGRGELSADAVIVLPEGGEVDEREIKRIVVALARVRRLTAEPERLQGRPGATTSTPERSTATKAGARAGRAAAIAERRMAIQDLVARLPLNEAVPGRRSGAPKCAPRATACTTRPPRRLSSWGDYRRPACRPRSERPGEAVVPLDDPMR
jgi:hypothetical protein